MKYLEHVHAFHERFNIPQPRQPSWPERDITDFRLAFINEEAREISEAVNQEDMEGVLDGLVDLVYVAIGMALMYGFDFDEAWDRVQRANMEKASDKSTDRHPMFDVHKPVGWLPPRMNDLVHPFHKRPALNDEADE